MRTGIDCLRACARGIGLGGFRLAACLVFGTMAGTDPAVAQAFQERLEKLKSIDPELHAFVLYMLGSGQHKVSGGFDYEFSGGSLDCSEKYDGGFDGCTIEIEVTADSYASGPDYRTANLDFECEASITTTDAHGMSGYESNREEVSLSFSGGGNERETLEIGFSFYSYTPIVNVRVSDISCELSSID